MTRFTTKLLAVGDEACLDVVHDLELDVHCEMEFLEDLVFSPDPGCSNTIVKLVLFGAGLEPLYAGVVKPDQAHALSSLGVNHPVIHFLNLLGLVVEVWWRYPGSNPGFWWAWWHCQRAELRSEHKGAEGDKAWGVMLPLVTVVLQHLLQSLHVLYDLLSFVIRSNVVDSCHNYYLKPIRHVEVIPPQCNRHVSDPPTHYGVNVKVQLRGTGLRGGASCPTLHTRSYRPAQLSWFLLPVW